jgi:hypothetical protein
VYSGGTAIGQTHEKFVLGYPEFTGDGYIKPVFSDDWSKFNLVRPADPPVAGDTLLKHAAVGAADPGLLGFELYGPIELTEGQLVLPNSGTDTTANPNNKNLTFTVKEGTLTIGKNASLITQTDAVVAATFDACKLVIDEKGSVVVNGKLHIGAPTDTTATGPKDQPLNYGNITVNEGGVLFADNQGLNPVIFDAFNYGTVKLLGGSSLLYSRNILPLYDTYIGPGTSARAIRTTGQLDVTFTRDSLTLGNKDTAILPATWAVWPAPKPLTINGVGVTVKAPLASFSNAAGEFKSVTVTGGGKLTLEKPPHTTSFASNVEPVSGITVTGTGSQIVVEPTTNSFTTAIPLVLDNGAKGTFKQNTDPTLTATLLTTGVTAKNGATVEYTGAPTKYSTPSAAVVYSGYNVILDKGLDTLTGITLTGGATLTAPSFAPGGSVSLTDSTLKFSSGAIATNTNTWTLVGSTVEFASMTSSASAPLTLSAGSTVHVKGTLAFSDTAAEVTLSDAASQITGEAGAKITSSAASGKLTIKAPGGNTSVKGLAFTGTAPALSTEIGFGKTATHGSSETIGWVLP